MKIYNSLTRKKEELIPLKKGRIGMYVCGPTVYDEPHIGHARSAYIFDAIRRYLEYKGYKVTFVRNVTDVDDKIIEKAKKVHGDKYDYSLVEYTNSHNKIKNEWFRLDIVDVVKFKELCTKIEDNLNLIKNINI